MKIVKVINNNTYDSIRVTPGFGGLSVKEILKQKRSNRLLIVQQRFKFWFLDLILFPFFYGFKMIRIIPKYTEVGLVVDGYKNGKPFIIYPNNKAEQPFDK